MNLLLAIVIGCMYAVGLFLMMRRNLIKLVIGLALLGQAANLLIFTVAGVDTAQAPLIPNGQTQPQGDYADPLPQALILTAIVIGFGVIAFTLALFHRAHLDLNADDVDQLRTTDT